VHKTLLFLNDAEVRVLQLHLLLSITLIENLWRYKQANCWSLIEHLTVVIATKTEC